MRVLYFVHKHKGIVKKHTEVIPMEDKAKEIAQQLCNAANQLPPAAQEQLLAFAMGMVAMSQTQQSA